MHWDEILQGKIYWLQRHYFYFKEEMVRIDVCAKFKKYQKRNYPRVYILQKL